MRLLGISSLILGALSAAGEVMDIAFPTARWFFDVSRQVPGLKFHGFPWFGWLSAGIFILCGLAMIARSFKSGPRNPITTRRIRRFCEIKRGYYSLVFLLLLGGLASLDQLVVGKRALAVKYDGKWCFPFHPPA